MCLSRHCPEYGCEWQDELPALGRDEGWPSCQLCDEPAWLIEPVDPAWRAP